MRGQRSGRGGVRAVDVGGGVEEAVVEGGGPPMMLAGVDSVLGSGPDAIQVGFAAGDLYLTVEDLDCTVPVSYLLLRCFGLNDGKLAVFLQS